MATLVLGAAGAALGSVFGGVGAILGRAAGAVAGYVLDQALFGDSRRREGPRLSDLEVQGSTEGAVLPRLYGRARLAGQIIWATDFEETVKSETQGGKGGGSVTTTEYSYYGNFAVALCEGPIAHVGRIWADGRPLDTTNVTWRLYRGDEAQTADSLILAKQEGDVPAYRGTAYAVFERLPLAPFGNRLPQLSFEVTRPVAGMEDHVRAVCVIPGSTEFGYEPQPVRRLTGEGRYGPENTHAERQRSDWDVSLDELQALCPQLEWVTLVVAWFGSDLRAGQCLVEPKVDDQSKTTDGADWAVAGLTRATAARVSLSGGRPAYGGSPSDASVMRAVQDLKGRGLKVALAPFLLMDIAAGNALPDPYTGATGQPAFPWRGLITGDPAPGRAGSADKTAAAADQIAAFLGSAARTDFAASGGAVTYSGPAEWRYRRMVLHYAHLAALAGGVDAFLIGSELRGLSTLRSSQSAFPFVDGLKALAADVRAVLGAATGITYAADWSEYFGHQPADGTGDVHFHLDPLWADANVDAVGIDLYHPLADWRDEAGHADEAGGRSPYNAAYLGGNVRGGEGFDWYYASAADRAAQIRTPIADGAAGKPWVFRFKDLQGWWENPHHDRPGGVESAAATAWQPQSKPFWLCELGCPAVDKGANQPNVFYDPKSAQSALPYYSSGGRDDAQQRSYIEAFQRAFDPAHPAYAGLNPVSNVTGGRMIEPARIALWAWDARPYPWFPRLASVWSDGGNWHLGHWLNGRLGAASLAGLIAAVLKDHGFSDYRIEDVDGTVGGYVVNQTLSARATLEPLLQAFGIDAADAGASVLFRGRGRPSDAAVAAASLIDRAEEPLLRRIRAQETELASEVVLRAIQPENDYRMAAAASRRLAGQSRRTATVDLTAVLEQGAAEQLTDRMLRDIWSGRDRFDFGLPPSLAAIEAGDLLALELDAGGAATVLAERIEDGIVRRIAARRAERGSRAAAARAPRQAEPETAPSYGAPAVRVLELAPPPDGSDAHAPRLAVFAEPWPGLAALYGGVAGGGFRLLATLAERATMGRLEAPLAPGPLGRFDGANAIEASLFGGTLASLPDIDVLAGGNLAAVRAGNGAWEILQFARAELVGDRRYRLTRLLRGQGGSEEAMRAGAAAGADFVLLDGAIAALPVRPDALGVPRLYRVGPAQDDHAGPSFAEFSATAEGRGLKPFSPVHLRARRAAATGDVSIGWIRRTRFGGDAWEPAEVPLNEAAEAYRLDILDGTVLRRSVEVAAPAFVYSAAAQTSDFGALPATLRLRVVQLSATAGPGFATEETINV